MFAQPICITLPGDGTDFDHWRSVARALLVRGIAPEAITWQTDAQQQQVPDLFASPAPEARTLVEDTPTRLPLPIEGDSAAATPELTVPSWWLKLAQACVLHVSPERFALLYRMLYRMQREPGLRHDPLDPDRLRIDHMVKAVRREMHKMHAFVRFRPVTVPDDPVDGTGPLHVAWFEPEHYITQAVAPFFVKRFANMRWAILTPQCSLRWWPHAPNVAALETYGVTANNALQPLRGRAGVLSWGPGAQASDAPAPDAGESLWLTYYAHTFNPARLKVNAMTREMPRRYWANLPEAKLISPLIQTAQARSADMLARGPSRTQRRLPKSNTGSE